MWNLVKKGRRKIPVSEVTFLRSAQEYNLLDKKRNKNIIRELKNLIIAAKD